VNLLASNFAFVCSVERNVRDGGKRAVQRRSKQSLIQLSKRQYIPSQSFVGPLPMHDPMIVKKG
jgi:hypothetical protein